MMGQHDRSESLFYYFKLDDYIPKNHLLRLIDEHVSFTFVRERLKDSYSDTGRPSIDPELLFLLPAVHQNGDQFAGDGQRHYPRSVGHRDSSVVQSLLWLSSGKWPAILFFGSGD
jgi:hypothetical protein